FVPRWGRPKRATKGGMCRLAPSYSVSGLGSGTRAWPAPLRRAIAPQVESTGHTEHVLRPARGRNVDPVPGRWGLDWGEGPDRRPPAFARSIVVQDRADAAVPGEQRVAAVAEQVEVERLVGLPLVVALDLDGDRLGRLAGGEGQRAGPRDVVVVAGRGGAV